MKICLFWLFSSVFRPFGGPFGLLGLFLGVFGSKIDLLGLKIAYLAYFLPISAVFRYFQSFSASRVALAEAIPAKTAHFVCARGVLAHTRPFSAWFSTFLPMFFARGLRHFLP